MTFPGFPGLDDDAPDRGVFQTTEEKVELWRLGQLVKSYSERVAVLDEHDVAGLECLAKCKSDLHQIVKAFGAGCTLGQAMAIFL